MRASFVLLCAVSLTSLFASPAARADSLAATNQAALARAFALPALGRAAPAVDGQWSLAFDIATEFVDKEAGGEALLLDGESQRWALGWRGGIAEGWDIGIEIPLLHVGGGFMDGLVEDWHDLFGLPNGGREDAPQDRYRYAYTRDGVVVLDTEDDGTALGDVRVGIGRALGDGLMLRAELKLPTGDEDRLAGGNFGGALWTDWALPFDAASRWGGFLSAGVSANEKADALESQQNEIVPFGGVGLDLRLLDSLAALAQLYFHAPLYDETEIAALDRPGAMLTLGGRWCAGGGTCVELSFSEDLAVGVSPDFSLRFALRLR